MLKPMIPVKIGRKLKFSILASAAILFWLMPGMSHALVPEIAASSPAAKIRTPFGTSLESVDDKTQIGWEIAVDGVKLSPKQLTIVNEQLGGQVVYGRNPASGRDQWAYHERGGGGSVTLPFAVLNGRLYVAVVQQNRPLQSKVPVLNAVRGFLDPDKTHFEIAAAELGQEMGLIARPIKLPGPGANPNSTFFETWGEGEGISFWAVPVSTGMLEKTNDELRFKKGALKPAEGDKIAEIILGSRLIRWEEAAGLGDMMTLSGISRLLAWLRQQGKLKMAFD